jgi:hypothetical protein
VISLPPSVRIYLCAQPIDGRRGIDALSAMVRSTLDIDPFCGAAVARVYRSWVVCIAMRCCVTDPGPTHRRC